MVSKIATTRKIVGLIFLLPALFLLGVFVYYPLVKNVYWSFTNYTGFPSALKYIGFDNYVYVLKDVEGFWNGLSINFQFAFITVILQLPLGFILAYFVYNLTRGWQNFFKVSLYIPVVLPAAVVGLLWTFVYSPNFGLLNQFLKGIGLGFLSHAWLGEYQTALGAVIIANLWRFVGMTMVLYYVTMMGISEELIEAAQIDGASSFKRMIHIFIPLTKKITELNCILTVMGCLKAFDIFYLMTQGGPGDATNVLGLQIYKTAFTGFKFSRASTISLLLFIVILIVTVIIQKAFQIGEAKK